MAEIKKRAERCLYQSVSSDSVKTTLPLGSMSGKEKYET